MVNKKLIWIITIWVTITVLNYYYFTFFILPLALFLFFLFFTVIFIAELVRLLQRREKVKRYRIEELIVYSIILPLTFFHQFTASIIEKMDWHLQYNKRCLIVEQVKNYTLNPNVSWNGSLCELQYIFPVLSNDGNLLIIERENSTQPNVTVEFFIYRDLLDHPPTKIVYTNDLIQITELEQRINLRPKDNWKLEDNWYRTVGF